MGLEIQVNSLEEMCDLMCNNKIPKKAPEGQIKVTDRMCRRCMYSSQIGAGDHYVGCMYADKEHHCRTLDPDYVHGYCKYFKKGPRKTDDPYRSTYFRAELPPRALHER